MDQKVDLAKIKKLRKEKGISLKRMALLLGYKTGTGYFYLESERCAITANILIKIANIFGVPMEDLFLSPRPTDSVETEQAATLERTGTD